MLKTFMPMIVFFLMSMKLLRSQPMVNSIDLMVICLGRI